MHKHTFVHVVSPSPSHFCCAARSAPLQPGTFAAELLAHGPKPGQLGAVRTFHLTVGRRVPLEGEELEAYEAAKAAAEAEKSDTGVRL